MMKNNSAQRTIVMSIRLVHNECLCISIEFLCFVNCLWRCALPCYELLHWSGDCGLILAYLLKGGYER